MTRKEKVLIELMSDTNDLLRAVQRGGEKVPTDVATAAIRMASSVMTFTGVTLVNNG